MAKSKKMDETYFANFLKETTVFGELIRARQDEKQSLMDEFDRESKRFHFGKISEKALSASVEKTNKEINRIDREIKSYMKKGNTNLQKAMKFVNDQEPRSLKATLSGVKESRSSPKKSSGKKKSSSKTKKSSGVSKKKTVKKAVSKPSKKTVKAAKKKSSGVSKKKTAKKTSGKKKSSSKKKK